MPSTTPAIASIFPRIVAVAAVRATSTVVVVVGHFVQRKADVLTSTCYLEPERQYRSAGQAPMACTDCALTVMSADATQVLGGTEG